MFPVGDGQEGELSRADFFISSVISSSRFEGNGRMLDRREYWQSGVEIVESAICPFGTEWSLSSPDPRILPTRSERFSCLFNLLVRPGPAASFQELNKRLLISNDSYIRTTSAYHKETSQKLWNICSEKGDIYLGKYEVSGQQTRSVLVVHAGAEASHGTACVIAAGRALACRMCLVRWEGMHRPAHALASTSHGL